MFDGYQIVRVIKSGSRSHIYLAVDQQSGERVVIKTPSVDMQASPAALERFLLEEWIARRINSPHVLKPCSQTRQRNYIYVVTEYVEGQTLAQWLIDNPKPDLPTVRGILEQIAKGLQAFHRLEMVYQDLKPDNIMIDSHRHREDHRFRRHPRRRLGGNRLARSNRSTCSAQRLYAAPEYFLRRSGATQRADLYSLGVIAYQMLAGDFPYGTDVPKSRTTGGAEEAGLQERAQRRPRNPGLGGRCHRQGRASRPLSNATRKSRNSSSTCTTRTRPFSTRPGRR